MAAWCLAVTVQAMVHPCGQHRSWPLRLVSLTDPPGVEAQPTPAGFPGRRDTGQRRRVVGRPEGGGCVCISHRPLLKKLPRFRSSAFDFEPRVTLVLTTGLALGRPQELQGTRSRPGQDELCVLISGPDGVESASESWGSAGETRCAWLAASWLVRQRPPTCRGVGTGWVRLLGHVAPGAPSLGSWGQSQGRMLPGWSGAHRLGQGEHPPPDRPLPDCLQHLLSRHCPLRTPHTMPGSREGEGRPETDLRPAQ